MAHRIQVHRSQSTALVIRQHVTISAEATSKRDSVSTSALHHRRKFDVRVISERAAGKQHSHSSSSPTRSSAPPVQHVCVHTYAYVCAYEGGDEGGEAERDSMLKLETSKADDCQSSKCGGMHACAYALSLSLSVSLAPVDCFGKPVEPKPWAASIDRLLLWCSIPLIDGSSPRRARTFFIPPCKARPTCRFDTNLAQHISRMCVEKTVTQHTPRQPSQPLPAPPSPSQPLPVQL